jgi:putative transposase
LNAVKPGFRYRSTQATSLRDDADLARHVDYIHINPVKHGHVGTPADWPYSSIHRYIRQGIVPADWAVDLDESESGFGE